MRFSKDGILLADVPNAGVAVKRETGSSGGNDSHDARSGKFAPKAGPKPDDATALPNVDPIEFKRMLDAVRDAAREFDLPEEGDIREFLQGRAKNPGQVDIDGFMRLVQEQIKTDIVDILDSQLRAAGSNPRGRRTVKLAAPRGYVQRTLRGLPEDAIAEIMHRLQARGHADDKIDDFFSSKVKPEALEPAKAKRKAIAAADDWTPPLDERFEFEDPEETRRIEMTEMAEAITKNFQPVINVTVEAPEPKPMRREVVRDEKGLAVAVREVPDE